MARKLNLEEEIVPAQPLPCVEIALRPGGCYARHFHHMMRRDLLLASSREDAEGAISDEEQHSDDWF